MGHRVSRRGIKIDQDEVAVIVLLEVSTNLCELRGFVGYYRRFIEVEGYAVVVALLNNLLRKDEEYVWTPDQQQASKLLKERLIRGLVLRPPNWSKDFHMDVDISAFEVGVVLSQKDEKGKDYPIYYAKTMLSTTENKYSTIEPEALGMVYTKEKFRHYLLGCAFVVYVDQYALKHLV